VKKSKKRKASKSPPSRGSKGSKEVQSKTNGGGKKLKLDSAAAAAAATADAAPKVASPKAPVTAASGVKRARSADSVSPPHATVDTAVTTAKSKKPKPSASPPATAPAAVPVAVTKPAKAKPKANAAAAAAADSASPSPVNNAAAHTSGRATPKKAAQSGSSEVSSPRGKAVVSSPKQLPAASPTGDRHVRFSKENHVQRKTNRLIGLEHASYGFVADGTQLLCTFCSVSQNNTRAHRIQIGSARVAAGQSRVHSTAAIQEESQGALEEPAGLAV